MLRRLGLPSRSHPRTSVARRRLRYLTQPDRRPVSTPVSGSVDRPPIRPSEQTGSPRSGFQEARLHRWSDFSYYQASFTLTLLCHVPRLSVSPPDSPRCRVYFAEPLPSSGFFLKVSANPPSSCSSTTSRDAFGISSSGASVATPNL